MTSQPAPAPVPAPAPGRVLTARSPEDVLAAIPEVLGFEPADSVVMLTFGGAHTFHARVDLPTSTSDLPGMVELLLEPARRHRVRSVVLVVYTGDQTLSRRASRTLERTFTRAGISVGLLLRADGRRWFAPSLGAPAHGVPYDLTAHQFRVESVLEGVVTHGSRAELADTISTDPAAMSAVAALVATTEALDAFDVAGCVAEHVERGTTFSDVELAALAQGVQDVEARDAAWCWMSRATATQHVRLWSDAARRVPPDLLGGIAAVLAFAAWLAGQGALSWCAVDRARESDPGNTLAALVGDLLTAAVPPSTWDEWR